MSIESAGAVLSIEVNVSCPICGNYIDLMQIPHLNDEGQVLKQACPTNGNHWIDEHEHFLVEDVPCEECGSEFNVDSLIW